MYEDRFLQVMHATTAEQLKHRLVAFGEYHGFPAMCSFVAIDHVNAATEFTYIDNYPDALNDLLDSQPIELARLDPVMQHCKFFSKPVAWDRTTYLEARQEPLWETCAAYGIETGLSVAAHLPQGRHFLMSIERKKPLSKRRDQLTRLLCELQLMVVLAADTAMRTMVQPAEPGGTAKLTPQELRCLQWTAIGLTAFEVGEKLNIAERTAVKHLHNAMHKLGCNNKHHAAMAAARVGLISL
jgi:DNA-binding CsgD family transcriptional regulator